MTAYAVARLREVRFGPQIAEYLRRIDDTLDAFGGRFLVHGDPYEVKEGSWTGDTIIIAFPDPASAHAWYDSPAYRAILPLRTDNSAADVIIVAGTEPGHRGVDALKNLPPVD
ncbi:DUF1330 domain-containing protein [Kitasatospora sp. NPDC059571]|uniref:DUF1330 domain-containing protein n=1 Tax=Kitasatospora sp. NPDC059571 TaxID=3346871 RepID=UPI0036BD7135